MYFKRFMKLFTILLLSPTKFARQHSLIRFFTKIVLTINLPKLSGLRKDIPYVGMGVSNLHLYEKSLYKADI